MLILYFYRIPPFLNVFSLPFSRFKSFAPAIARPRVACFVSQKIFSMFSALPFWPLDAEDSMALDVFTPQCFFCSSYTHFRITNAYVRLLCNPPRSVFPETALPKLDFPYLVAADFNSYNLAVELFRVLFSAEEMESTLSFGLASELGFSLLHTPRTYTRFPFTSSHRPSAIDLAFANLQMFPAFRSWEASFLPPKGSNHVPILLSLEPPKPYSDQPRPRWQDANWLPIAHTLPSRQTPLPSLLPSPVQLDPLFSSSLSILTATIEASAPQCRLSPRSKP